MATVCDLFEEDAVLDDALSLAVAGTITEAAVLDDAIGAQLVGQTIAEAAVLDDAIVEMSGLNIEEAAVLDDAVQISGTLVSDIVETARLSDDTRTELAQNIAEDGELADAIDGTSVTSFVAEAAVLDDAIAGSQTIVDLIAETAVLDDAIIGAAKTDIEESAVLDDAVATAVTVVDRIEEAAVLDDVIALGGSTIVTLITEDGVLDDATTQHLIATNFLEEEAYLSDAVVGGGNAAWTAHTEPWAMSRFTNQPWNSMAVIGGALFAAGPDGIHQLAGADDAGVDIDARVDHDWLHRTLDFRGEATPNKHLKRPRYLYLNGVKADGQVAVMLGYVTIGGAEAEAEYLLPELSATGFVNTRVALGRGIRSQHLRPSIRNVDGADFEYDSGYIAVDSLARNL